MELRRKLEILADAAKYDASCASGGAKRAAPRGGIGSSEGMGICHTYTPDGRCVSLLKILFTNYCIYDCRYCTSRISSDVPRARFTVAEVVALTLDFYKRNYIEGLFLSSGVLRDPDTTLEQLIAVARTLREEHGFGGYIHLKSTPGASSRLLEEAGRFADRLSVNVELPTERDLAALAPDKTMAAAYGSMQAIAAAEQAATASGPRGRVANAASPPKYAPAGQSSQMIVGATDASDADILGRSAELYRRFALRRVYYSAFSPFAHGDPRLPAKAPPLVREHRLYQADWLVRFYGFRVDELTTPSSPNLDLAIDPKLAWALAHREFFPVDVNRAARDALLRVPGLGRTMVNAVVAARRHTRLRREHLRRLRVPRRAFPFLTTEDDVLTAARLLDAERLRRVVESPVQLSLFDARSSARDGEL
jgi:putative DNA modification/repair radical SAM protein